MKQDHYCIHHVAGEELYLLPEKAIYWKRMQMLLLADLHLGKSGHFRKAGIPVSSLVHWHDLNRLSAIIDAWKIKAVCLLGDLFHSNYNREWDQFVQWRSQHQELSIHLIKGNHDILDEQLMLDEQIAFHHTSHLIAPFFLSHDHVSNPGGNCYQLHGHVHPGVRLHGKGLQSLSLPCFYFGKDSCILPSFGGFTGHTVLRPAPDDTVYIIYDDCVRLMPRQDKL